MPPPAPRWASTLASTGAPTARATAASRATSPGLAPGSRPTLLSPHTTRSAAAAGRPAARSRLRRSLAWKRGSTWRTIPGWTSPTRTVPAAGGGGRSAHHASASSGRATATVVAAARTRGATPGASAAAAATLTATSSRLTAHTPPTAATPSSGGAFHWLAPSSPHGPPSPSQERTASPATNALGSSTSAAPNRRGLAGGQAPRSRQASQPSGSHNAASSIASGTMNGPTFGTRKALTARKKPVPDSQARTAASRASPAARASSSTGTSPTSASHHSAGAGNASASGVPATSATTRPRQVLTAGDPLAAQRFMATYLISRYSAMPSAPPSRPKPDCLTPPNGAAGLDTIPWFRPTMPVSRPSTTRKARLRSRV